MIETLIGTTILPAILPALTDGLKLGIRKVLGAPMTKPKTVEEEVKLIQANTERLRAIAELDKPEVGIHPFVANYRALFRYVLATLVIGSTMLLTFVSLDDPTVKNYTITYMFDMARSAFFFAYGDRVYRNLKKGG